MMNEIVTALKNFFHASDEIQADLSERWRPHSNRRTTIVFAIVGIFVILLYVFAIRPPDDFPLDELVTIPAGSTLTAAAKLLKENDVVRSAWVLRALVIVMGHEKTIHAGDYLFKEPKDVFVVARAISIGAFGLEPARVRIPEGATTKQMAIILRGPLKRFNEDRFLATASPLEGYLFPDTYFFLPNTTEDTAIQAMRQNFDHHMNAPIEGYGSTTLAELIRKSGKSEEDIVILASIIEREARNTKDRRLISGVLWNRLAKDMPLQVDVTFLYTLGKGTFQLTTKDLVTDSPYNTYINKGLPPTPIGSPSLDSLIAAAMPTKHTYLFFLADHSGITHFCKDFACQQANKDRYF
ncbi:MAG: endolytic transglycosylase MltG [bacterium]|nr:endolytic transglycosylase MltG [bacterium]